MQTLPFPSTYFCHAPPFSDILYHSHTTPMSSNLSLLLSCVFKVRTMFIIFAAFAVCWAPYIVVLLSDSDDSFPMVVHLYASLAAHAHASVNFAIYGVTNNSIRAGYKQFVRQVLFNSVFNVYNQSRSRYCDGFIPPPPPPSTHPPHVCVM